MLHTLQHARKQISIWLGAGILMVLIQILLGGITRLTGSGLSITEWQPLVGALPPISHAQWRQSFEHYQQIAQFKKLNSHFTLSNYKGLFFWEWFHREWARLMGLVFIIPFIVFLLQGKFDRTQRQQLTGLFLLGGIQGLAGWLMVQSGLNDTDVSVSHIRLAVHFCLALILLLYILRMYIMLRPNYEVAPISATLQLLIALISFILGLQLIFGAFMAGTHAALYAPTWPDINGAFLMSSPGITGSFLHRVAYDPLLIQFVHRILAYLLICLFLIFFLVARRAPSNFSLSRAGNLPLLFLTIQVSLGIACLLYSATPIFIWLAVLHQLNGILLLLSMANVLFRSRVRLV